MAGPIATSSLLIIISEDFWVFLSIPSDRSIFSASVKGCTNIAIAEKEGKTHKSSLISKEMLTRRGDSAAILRSVLQFQIAVILLQFEIAAIAILQQFGHLRSWARDLLTLSTRTSLIKGVQAHPMTVHSLN